MASPTVIDLASITASMAVPPWPPDQQRQRCTPRESVEVLTEGCSSGWSGSRQRHVRPPGCCPPRWDRASRTSTSSTRASSSSRSIRYGTVAASDYARLPRVRSGLVFPGDGAEPATSIREAQFDPDQPGDVPERGPRRFPTNADSMRAGQPDGPPHATPNSSQSHRPHSPAPG